MHKPKKSLPEWLKVKIPGGENYLRIQKMLRSSNLHTVCEEARCPNIGGCWDRGTATFMILGDICTRACRYCAVTSGKPLALDPLEAYKLSKVVEKMNLKYVVITSVNRDDLENGGAEVFAECVHHIKKRLPACKVEVLIPDFEGKKSALEIVLKARPDTINHNIETVRSIFPKVRPKGDYDQSLKLLETVKLLNSSSVTKSGIMVGLGEKIDEIKETMKELVAVGCDLLTIGQYLQPSSKHIERVKWYSPVEFNELADIGRGIGFKHVVSGPLVRSSYHADEQHAALNVDSKDLAPV
ncbi:MAG: lipoyl synthase [SAR202 cluster bacterium]|nr:lipoyl synthase [SAR202 cluster bacterium]|tara:strand:- start:6672 stop:7565 length:894 start_codon:yes stop_codon:yes gene_type:complete